MGARESMVAASAVCLEQMLAAREHRAARNAAALACSRKAVLSVTLVMPGPVKDGALPRSVFDEALGALAELCDSRGWRVLQLEVFWLPTGPEALYVIDGEADLLKAACIELEEKHPLGRLWDLDVVVPGPRVLSRKQFGLRPRRCLVCERPAFECGRSRRHPLPELLHTIHMLVNNHDLY